MDDDKTTAGSEASKARGGEEAAVAKSETGPSAGSVVINVQSSPRSPRLAHLRPPSPLTPEAMHRIRLMTVQEQRRMTTDSSKLSPISPSTSLTSPTTSDLGSSRRSSVNVTTCSSSAWSIYREGKKSSSDFTDVDSDIAKDLFSPSSALSPAPFSPFGEPSPAAAFSESTSTLMRQRLHFTFDPKSPPFAPMAPATSGQFLSPPTPSYGSQRGRSWSDSDTVFTESTRRHSTCLTPTAESEESESERSVVLVPTKVDSDKNVYKKRLLRKYEEEGRSTAESITLGVSIDPDTGTEPKPFSSGSTAELRCPKSATLPVVHQQAPFPHPSRLLSRCASSLPDYGRGYTLWRDTHGSQQATVPGPLAPVESVRLPLLRVEETNVPKTQPEFGAWMSRQLFAVNPLWRAPPVEPARGTDIPGIHSLFFPFPISPTTTIPFALPAPVPQPSVRSIHRPLPIYPPHFYSVQKRFVPVNRAPLAAALGLALSRRSRSESDASYECHHCGQSFNSRDRLAKHLAGRHKEQCSSGGEAGPKNYVCTVCQKHFGRSDMLTRHMRLHTGIRPYVCHTCGQVFSRSDHLSTHQRTHTGEKPYQCPVCPYAASRRDMITRHMRSHARLADVYSGEASTSGVGRVTDAEQGTSGTEKAMGLPSEHWQATTPERSPGSDSDHQSASTGSTSTILCLEEEPGQTSPKDESS